MQEELRSQVSLDGAVDADWRTVAGLDVSYAKDSDLLAAAAVVLDIRTLDVVETAVVTGEADFPYVPGLLGFREVPVLLRALERLSVTPDLLVCDGYGLAHPRRFGLACHVGVVTGLPSFGVAKTAFTATYAEPGAQRGSWSPLLDGTDVVGRALRTQSGVKPVFVSPGHLVGLGEITKITLRMCPKFRIPEAIRRADSLSRAALRSDPADAGPDGPP